MEPILKTVIFNYSGSDEVLMGNKMSFLIDLNYSKKFFTVLRRKYNHCTSTKIIKEEFSESCALELTGSKVFLISHIDRVKMYCSETFKYLGEMPVQLFISDTREST